MICSLIQCRCVFILMRRRPPRATLAYPLFPSTTLFRSQACRQRAANGRIEDIFPYDNNRRLAGKLDAQLTNTPSLTHFSGAKHVISEERRVGQECVSECISRWSPYH